jgi:hypothetical protein
VTLEETLIKILDIFSTIYPKSDSTLVFESGTVTIATLSYARLTFTVAAGFKARLKKLYADPRLLDYTWEVGGVTYRSNEVEVDKPIDVLPGETIALYIANTGPIDQTLDYFIRGWGDALTSGGSS